MLFAMLPSELRTLRYAQPALHWQIPLLCLALEIDIVGGDGWVNHLHLTLGYLSRETKKEAPKTIRSVVGSRAQPAAR